MEEPDATPWGLMLIMALVMLSYPWLAIFNQRLPLLGVPLVLLYVFGVWGGLIVLSLLYRPRR